MTRYAIDERRGELAASWGAGYGDLVTAVAALPAGSTPKQRLTVAATLTMLSETLWHCYTHPASASPSTEANSEGWLRQHHRASFNLVLEIVQKPNLPDESGILIVSYDPVEECAHRVGRALHAIDDPELTAAVVTDLHTEIAAVEQAELGDLSGRAHQAVGLTRTDASPVQIAETDRVLSADPLGSERLFLDFDPTAAAVAAAHWLRAAADVASEASGIAVTDVLVEADNIEALPHATPTAVLKLLATGIRPYAVVISFVRDAMLVAEGEAPNLDDLDEAVHESDCLIKEQATSGPGAAGEYHRVRLTPLDPLRPARDLLEDLLSGIRGCRLVYSEYADADGLEDMEEGLDEAIDQAFCRDVRDRAAADRSRLL